MRAFLWGPLRRPGSLEAGARPALALGVASRVASCGLEATTSLNQRARSGSTHKQPFREALGGALDFEAFVQAVDIRGRSFALQNDASAAIACLVKGSTQSPQMQRCALWPDRAAARADADCLPYHVPGLTLTAEALTGLRAAAPISGRKRERGDHPWRLGPAVADELWSLVLLAVIDAGWRRVTVDAFATESNSRAPRFWSRFHEPGSEAIDALCVPDWARSSCPSCGSSHPEVRTPSRLPADSRWRRLDRALCILVLPAATLAPC